MYRETIGDFLDVIVRYVFVGTCVYRILSRFLTAWCCLRNNARSADHHRSVNEISPMHFRSSIVTRAMNFSVCFRGTNPPLLLSAIIYTLLTDSGDSCLPANINYNSFCLFATIFNNNNLINRHSVTGRVLGL